MDLLCYKTSLLPREQHKKLQIYQLLTIWNNRKHNQITCLHIIQSFGSFTISCKWNPQCYWCFVWSCGRYCLQFQICIEFKCIHGKMEMLKSWLKANVCHHSTTFSLLWQMAIALTPSENLILLNAWNLNQKMVKVLTNKKLMQYLKDLFFVYVFIS